MLKIPLPKKFKFFHYKPTFKSQKGFKDANAILSIKTKTNLLITPNQLETLRRKLNKPVKDLAGKLDFAKANPCIQKSAKPLQTRMGKGKGRLTENWLSYMKKNLTIINIRGYSNKNITPLLIKKITPKLHTKLKIIKRKRQIFFKDLINKIEQKTNDLSGNNIKSNR